MQTYKEPTANLHTSVVRHRTLNFWVIIAAIVLTPWEFIRYQAITIGDFAILAAVGLFISSVDLRQKISSRLVPHFIVTSIFFFAAIISLLIPAIYLDQNVNLWRAAVTGGQYMIIFLLLPILAIALSHNMNHDGFIKLVAMSYLIPQWFLLLVLTTLGSDNNFFLAGRALLSYENANSAAITLCLILPFYVLLTWSNKNSFWSIVGYIGLATSSSCVLLTGSASGLLSFLLIFLISFVAFWLKYKQIGFIKCLSILLTIIVSFIATSTFVLSVRPDADQLKFRIQAAEQLGNAVVDKTREMFAPHAVIRRVVPKAVVHSANTDTQTKKSPNIDSANEIDDVEVQMGVTKQEEAHASEIQKSSLDKLREITSNTEDRRIPSVSLRSEFMEEALLRIKDRHALFGEGLGQAQALHGERLVHTVYILLVEEGGVWLLLGFLLLYGLLYKNIWNADWPVEVKLCLSIACFALLIGSAFQTHMYLRFYWMPLLFAFSTPSSKETKLMQPLRYSLGA